ncbi:programmed cell death 6-interacting protein-like [Anopheles albimanus]|uniref:programmed cell death 6-interacting protein-like n=1 Tax=Anopheles albimanus TaxID=7167 RepID=UPI00163F67BB|nr:programmed cell death 6-interacting protein-like [Anopheles albimanus]
MELLTVPLKKPSEVDIAKPLKTLIQSNYRNLEADKLNAINEAVSELNLLRNAAVWKVFDRQESGLEINYRYHDQLRALEAKIPVQELQVPFKWKDAFDKGTIFGGRMSLTLTSIGYERTCVLFNIAALQSCVASAQSPDNDEGLKLAAKLFQQSAGIFTFLKTFASATVQGEPTPDLTQDSLAALANLMLAQAQEIFVFKAVKDNMKDLVVAKLCAQCEELYSETLRSLQRDSVRTLWEKEWIPQVAGRQAAMHALTMYYHSAVSKANKAFGEEISRLQKAVELFKTAQSRASKPTLFQDYASRAQKALADAKKDNDFIYNEIIPDVSTLPGPGKAPLAKVIPMPANLSEGFSDIFGQLVPVAVNQAQAACEGRKTEIVNGEIVRLREATTAMNGLLSSLNLPAIIEVTASGASLPPSLQEKASAVREKGGIEHLKGFIERLPELFTRNKEILDEAFRMMDEERDSDNQLRAQFKDRWTRTPSDKLAATFRANGDKYRIIIDNATAADKQIREKFAAHRRGIELLSMAADQLAKEIPSAGSNANQASNSSSAQKLRELLEAVETMKVERECIESELKTLTIDLKERFQAALAKEGVINEPAISLSEIGKVIGPLQEQVGESLARQETLARDIRSAHEAFTAESGVSTDQRDRTLSELAAAYDVFTELHGYLQEGETFYNGLTEILLVFQSKISDFCFARKTEKEELMKDLTHESSRQAPVAVTPVIPTHHTSTTASAPGAGGSSAPPAAAGASPPQAPTAAAPYPQQIAGMPMANAAYGGTMGAGFTGYVPPPMPAGFNPYGTLPYPTSYTGFPPASMMPPAYYGTYPGAYGHQQQQQQQQPGAPNLNNPGMGWQ